MIKAFRTCEGLPPLAHSKQLDLLCISIRISWWSDVHPRQWQARGSKRQKFKQHVQTIGRPVMRIHKRKLTFEST